MTRMSAAEQLDAIIAKLAGLPPEAQAEIDKELAEATGHMKWVPNPGPQTECYYCTADQILYGGQAGGGKALALDTPLPTPAGWTTMGAVAVGDVLFAADGTPTRVTAVSPVMIGRPCYVIRFSDDSEIVADADHRWFTVSASERDRQLRTSAEWRERRKVRRSLRGTGKRPDLTLRNSQSARLRQEVLPGRVRTTKEIAETLLSSRGALNHAVPVGGAIQAPEATLPIDPYLLGAWLGDGSSYKGEITTADAEILQAFHNAGYETAERTPITFGIYKFWPALRALDVAANKHIPALYLRASHAQRLALLQGLMDTDGFADSRGQCEFTTTRERLAFDMHELVCSLGIKSTICVGRATLNGRDCGAKYRIKFLTSQPAFRLTRKLARQKRQGFRGTSERRYVTAVERIDSVPVKCVAVDHPSHLYLAGRSFVPTHNTDVLLGLAAQEHKRSLVLRKLNIEVDYLAERLEEIVGHSEGLNKQKMRWNMPGRRIIQFGGCQYPGDERKYKGQPKDFIGIDEASEFHEQQVEYVIGWLRSADPNQLCRLVLATNPPTSVDGEWIIRWFAPWLDPEHPLYPYPEGAKLWFRRRADDDAAFEWFETEPEPEVVKGKPVRALTRTFIRSGLEDNPDYDRTDYAARLNMLPEPLRRRYRDGDFTVTAADDEWQLIPTEWILAAQARWTDQRPADVMMTSLGVDIAQGGADRTVIAPRYGTWFDRLATKPGAETPTGATAGAFVLVHRRDGAIVAIDMGGGWGGATLEWLTADQAMSESVKAFQPSGSGNGRTRDGKFTFYNTRAESWWALREALDPSNEMNLALPPDGELRQELAAPRYKIAAGAKIQVEDKADIKKRLGRSPDKGDAVVIAWHTGQERRRPRALTGTKGLPQFANGGRSQIRAWRRR